MTVRCPKCGSNAHSFQARHPFIYGKTETEVRCQLCGTRKYGAEADRLVEQALAHRAAAEEAERKFREQAEAERRARIAAAKEAELAREREEAERIAREEAEEQERLNRLAAELAMAELERIERERVEAERLATIEAEREARRARDRATSAALAEKKKMVDEMVARRLEQTTAARQARLDAPRLRRERLGAAHDAAVAERGEDAVCASPLCANPRPPERRYCGKGCSDHVARERYKARKASEGLTTP